jgi:nucleotide-binding universal stress UspA family protein
MLPLRKILCPMNFTEVADAARSVAAELAAAFSAELVLLHVVEPAAVTVRPSEGAATAPIDTGLAGRLLVACAEERLRQLAEERLPKQLRTQARAVYGNAASQIVEVADEEKVDLIVIATRGRTGLARLLFGSVTESVVRLPSCPVLAINWRSPEEARAGAAP